MTDKFLNDMPLVTAVASTLLAIPYTTPRLQRLRSTPGAAVVPGQVFKNEP